MLSLIAYLVVWYITVMFFNPIHIELLGALWYWGGLNQPYGHKIVNMAAKSATPDKPISDILFNVSISPSPNVTDVTFD